MRYPCGYRNDPRRECHCSIPQVEKYMNKISGPLLDRIDIHLEVPAVAYQELTSSGQGTSSAVMREDVLKARAVQRRRFEGTKTRLNARMGTRQIRAQCQLDAQGRSLLEASMNDLGLSARAHDKILRVARTIADLAGSERVEVMHLSEAINYRMLDRKLWT
jgi:magnesium chelatase family protein